MAVGMYFLLWRWGFRRTQSIFWLWRPRGEPGTAPAILPWAWGQRPQEAVCSTETPASKSLLTAGLPGRGAMPILFLPFWGEDFLLLAARTILMDTITVFHSKLYDYLVNKKIHSHPPSQLDHILCLICWLFSSLYGESRLHIVGIQGIFDVWMNALVMEMVGEHIPRKVMTQMMFDQCQLLVGEAWKRVVWVAATVFVEVINSGDL